MLQGTQGSKKTGISCVATIAPYCCLQTCFVEVQTYRIQIARLLPMGVHGCSFSRTRGIHNEDMSLCAFSYLMSALSTVSWSQYG